MRKFVAWAVLWASAANVGAQQSGVSAHQADLLHVLWLIAQVERRAEDGEEISERTLRHRLKVEGTDDKWRKLVREINAIAVRNLESRYSQCAAASRAGAESEDWEDGRSSTHQVYKQRGDMIKIVKLKNNHARGDRYC